MSDSKGLRRLERRCPGLPAPGRHRASNTTDRDRHLGGLGFGSWPATVPGPLESGDWTIVVMNADGSRGVAAGVAVGATLPGEPELAGSSVACSRWAVA